MSAAGATSAPFTHALFHSFTSSLFPVTYPCIAEHIHLPRFFIVCARMKPNHPRARSARRSANSRGVGMGESPRPANISWKSPTSSS